MKVLLFGATGMIGQGVLRECLLDPRIEEVRSLVRSPSNFVHPKLTEIVHGDFFDYTSVEGQLKGLDACFWCLGVSSAGMSEADYRRITYDMTLAAAGTIVRLHPAMTFCYISGAGADASETGRVMWARVKGQIENALRRLPFKAVYLFRPGFIQPLHGITSRTPLYRWIYRVLGPLFPLIKALFPKGLITTQQLGQAMIRAGAEGAPRTVLEMRDLASWGRPG